MLKKALIASAVLAASSGLAFANGGTYMPVETHTGNLYVGIGISADSGVIRNTQLVARGNRYDIGLTGVNGELFGGYGIAWMDRYYTGVEVFGQVSSNQGQFAGVNVKVPNQFGVRFQPGLKISDSTMLYADIGWVRAKATASAFGRSASERNNGLQLGLGMQTMIANNVSLRGGWDINRFQGFRDGAGRLTTQQYHLDLIYHFV